MSLSPRQESVVRLIARGLTDKEIAAELGVSPATVRGHVCKLLLKLRARCRAQAVYKWANR